MNEKGKLGSLRNARDGLLKLKAQMQGIESAIHELEVERNKGAIDFGRYLLDVRSNLDIKSKIWYPHRHGKRDQSW